MTDRLEIPNRTIITDRTEITEWVDNGWQPIYMIDPMDVTATIVPVESVGYDLDELFEANTIFFLDADTTYIEPSKVVETLNTRDVCAEAYEKMNGEYVWVDFNIADRTPAEIDELIDEGCRFFKD